MRRVFVDSGGFFALLVAQDESHARAKVSDVPPDPAVEVLAPGDKPREVLDRVGEYLDAGVRLVWVIDPKRRSAAVHRSMTDVRAIGAEDSLDGEDVLTDVID